MKQLFPRRFKLKNIRWNSIDQMCGNAKSITPIGGWKPRLMEHRKVTLNNLFVFPLSNTILLRGVRTRQLMLNAIIQTKGLKMIMVYSPLPLDLRVLILDLNWFSTRALKCRNIVNTSDLCLRRNN